MSAPTSTINRNNPPANTPVASVVVRSNFNAAADDIDALWSYVSGLITGVSSFNGRAGDVVLEDSDVVSALGFDPAKKMGNFFWGSPVTTVISLIPYSEYAFTINRLNNLKTSLGSLDLDLFINGTPVGGLSPLNVTTAPQNPSATSSNVVGVGDELLVAISNCSGPLNLKWSMLGIM